MADEIHTVVYSDWRAEPEFARLRQALYAVECEDKRLIAEKAVRIALLEADNARLRREAAEWTEMLARDGIRFEEQPVMDPVPPLYFWLGKDADWPVVGAFNTVVYKAGFMAATKYVTGHLSDEQVALVQDAEWDSYAGRTSE